MHFLSERNIELHKEYLNNLMLKYSVFEKSYPEICGCKLRDIYKTKIPFHERENAAKLFSEIAVHKIYFSSFADENSTCRKFYSADNSIVRFLYKIKEMAKEGKSGFLLVYDDFGRIGVYCGEDYGNILIKYKVLLALDLYEHAYFLDYGFNRENYILNAISAFDLKKIEKSRF